MTPKRTIRTKRCGFLLPCLFAVLLFAVLVFCAPQAEAASVVASGTCGAQGDNLKWSLDSDGTLTISGKGEMRYYDSKLKDKDFRAHINSIKTVVIENGVTSISNHAFDEYLVIEENNIYTSLISNVTHYKPFKNLKEVRIAGSVQRVGGSAFEQCPALEKVIFEDGVESIEGYAFYYCEKLKSIKIPGSVKKIGNAAFENCTGLEKATLEEGIEEIGVSVFYNTAVTEMVIPSTVKSINGYSFYDCDNLRQITFLTKSCTIPNWAEIPKAATIYGYKGSTVEAYAKENGNPFVVINTATEPEKPTEPTNSIHTHTYGVGVTKKKASCTKTGEQVFTCSTCGATKTKTLPKTEHNYQTKVYAATTAKNGKMVEACAVCGLTRKSSKIPKIEVLKLDKTVCAYDGTRKTPVPIVKDSKGKTLKKSTDYKVKYASGRTECGTYKVIVAFKGNYSGKQTLTFQIVPAKVTGLKQVKGDGTRIVWNKTDGAAYYEIYFKDSGMKNFQIVEKTKGKPLYKKYGDEKLYHSNIEKGTVMQVKVRAVYKNADGTKLKGAFSKALTVTAQ